MLLVCQHYCFVFFFVISQFLVVVIPPLVVITPLSQSNCDDHEDVLLFMRLHVVYVLFMRLNVCNSI